MTGQVAGVGAAYAHERGVAIGRAQGLLEAAQMLDPYMRQAKDEGDVATVGLLNDISSALSAASGAAMATSGTVR